MATPEQEPKFGADLENSEGENAEYKLDVYPTMSDNGEIDDYLLGEMEGEGEEGEEGRLEKEEDAERDSVREEKLSDKRSIWDFITGRSYEGEMSEQEYSGGEEEGEKEEKIRTSTISISEKFEEDEDRLLDEFDRDMPAEVLAEREAIISKIKELQKEHVDLRKRNRLLELWVFRNMKKTQQRMTPSDSTKTAEQMEEVYRGTLREYKIQVDEILTQQSEMSFELQNYTQKVHVAKEEDHRLFSTFLEREKQICTGLIFAKTGKKITDKMMDRLIRRQIVRRDILARDRHNYIMLQHRLDDLNTRLRIAETLGEGMTAMDYEALHIANVGYKDRLDERDRELEKLRNKIAVTVNGVAQYKEKEVCIVEDIDFAHENLIEHREANTKVRERLNVAHVQLNEVRETLNTKTLEAGLLVAQQQLIEMEKMMNQSDDLLKKIGELEAEIRQYQPAKEEMKRWVRMASV